jgi:hypothetical protein
MRRVRRHLTFANIASLTAVFIALGGTAMAATIITDNSQVGPDTISGHKPRTGNQPNIIGGTVNGTDIATAGVVGRNLDSNSVNGPKVADGSLTGADIADRSGVDTCQPTLTVKLGPICAGSDGGARNWASAVQYCADFDLRLPSLAEAVALASNHAVPGVTTNQQFWTDNEFVDGNSFDATVVTTHGGVSHVSHDHESATHQTVCVTDPSA